MASFVRMNRTNVSTAEGTSSLSDIFTKSVSLLNTPDPIYGSGIDGDATISTNTSLTSDMQYANLTINSSIVLNPNGYRIFVRDTLTMHSGSRIGYTAGFSTAGSIAQGGATNTSVTHSLGGSSATQTATAPAAVLGGTNYYYYAMQAVRGWAVSASSTTPTFLRGGAGGTGGPGGGVVILAARYIAASVSTSFISATTSGTSSGGGGGVVIVISSGNVMQPGITIDVTGASGASNGTSIYLQVG
jgi:hypothetical protein